MSSTEVQRGGIGRRSLKFIGVALGAPQIKKNLSSLGRQMRFPILRSQIALLKSAQEIKPISSDDLEELRRGISVQNALGLMMYPLFLYGLFITIRAAAIIFRFDYFDITAIYGPLIIAISGSRLLVASKTKEALRLRMQELSK